MADLTKIFINGKELPKPNEFKLERQDIYAAEITTCTGKLIADKVGWRYSDMNLEWGALTQEEVDILISMSGECTLTFDDQTETPITESIIRTSVVSMKNRWTHNGITYWKDVSVSIRFIDAHR